MVNTTLQIPMSEILEILLHIQDLEDRHQFLTREIERLPEAIKQEEERISSSQQKLQELKNRLGQIRKEYDLHELDVKENEEKRNKLNAQLFQVKTNEEYRALQAEIEHLNREKARLEDEMISLLEEEEEVKRKIELGKETVKQVELEGKEKIGKLTSELKNREKELTEVEDQLKNYLFKLPPEIKNSYDRIKKARGSAVARVVDQTCSGCHARITPQLYNELLKADRIHFCEICGRFLIYDRKG
ncbi:hypothetical protein DRP53_05705 [candidate division WOR-3 bacterium]|uniref:C4-type zinc ribbon domain-containing protein n=1 Tax=candidate division WOR-3 bacterium TaxID=2052148 RepID=A0A660SI56_UNCW3|nr:MAG: hypothetical protein DRP53_05705 [candidate division WOR-3 bacterium]